MAAQLIPAPLADFLRQSRAVRPAWGVSDCLMWPADWMLRLTGEDPGAPFRGRYASEAEAEAILAEQGGIVACLGRAAMSVGLVAVERPAPGDVGVVVIPDGARALAVGAVFAGPGGWAHMAGEGLQIGRVRRVLGLWGRR